MKLVRGFGIALVVAVIWFSLFPVPAFASHGSTYVVANVLVWHGPKTVATYTTLADCGTHGYTSGDPCPVTVITNHRDAGRYVRWGGPVPLDASVPAAHSDYVLGTYYGPSTWYILVPVLLCSTSSCGAAQADTSTMYFSVTVSS